MVSLHSKRTETKTMALLSFPLLPLASVLAVGCCCDQKQLREGQGSFVLHLTSQSTTEGNHCGLAPFLSCSQAHAQLTQPWTTCPRTGVTHSGLGLSTSVTGQSPTGTTMGQSDLDNPSLEPPFSDDSSLCQADKLKQDTIPTHSLITQESI